MRSGFRDTVLFIAYLLAGLVAATLAGWLTLQGSKHVIPPFRYLLPYLALGFSGALIYVSVRSRGVLLALVMVATLVAGNILLTNSWSARSIFGTAIQSVFAGGAYVTGALLFRAMPRVRLGKFLFLGALLATASALSSFVLLVSLGYQPYGKLILGKALAGLRLGALSGFLFEVVDFIGLKLAGKTARAD